MAGLDQPRLWTLLFLIVATFSLLPRGLVFSQRVEIGAIADRDYVAPADLLLPDDESTERRREKAREEVRPVWDLDPRPTTAAEISRLFEEGRSLLQETRPSGALTAEEVERLTAASHLKTTPELLHLLLRKGFSAELEERFAGLAGRVAGRGVVLSKESLLENRLRGISLRNLQTGGERLSFDLYEFLPHPRGVDEVVAAEVRAWEALTTAERRLLRSFLVDNLPPNLHFNPSETQAREQRAAVEVGPSFNQVRRGQVIARKGDELTAPAVAQILASRRGAGGWMDRLLPPLGVLAILAGVAWLAWLALHAFSPRPADHHRHYVAFLLLLGLSLAGARWCFLVAEALGGTLPNPPLSSAASWAWAVPLASPALLAGLLFNRRMALLQAAIFCVLVGRLAGANAWEVTLYGLAGSLGVIFALERYQVNLRLVMTRLGLVSSATNMVMVLALAALAGKLEGGAVGLGFDLLCAFSSGLLAAAVASFTLPILEAALGLTTDIRLAELSNTNLPLLRRLALEAPGTFQHSLMVAHLSKQAAEAIGADAPLAYAAGLYHDVGKMTRPEYFVENQRSGSNPHDKLQPTMSAQILIRHIKDGLTLAREHHLPQPLVDAVEQHHGTRLIKYFFARAAEAGEPPEEMQFRYPGPRPQDKVMGVLMLADAVEAASRTLNEPSPGKLRALIRTIVDDCLGDRQLEDTNLTLSDLAKISETFLAELTTVFHQRIDYPGFDFNKEEKPGRPRLRPVPAAGSR